jgi:hypothetical protein
VTNEEFWRLSFPCLTNPLMLWMRGGRFGPSGALKRHREREREKAIKAQFALIVLFYRRAFYVLRRLRIDCAQIKRFTLPPPPSPRISYKGGELECKKWLAQIETLAARCVSIIHSFFPTQPKHRSHSIFGEHKSAKVSQPWWGKVRFLTHGAAKLLMDFLIN